jgi:hypothetical protein
VDILPEYPWIMWLWGHRSTVVDQVIGGVPLYLGLGEGS